VLGANIGIGVVILILVLAGMGLHDYYRYDVKEQWREAAELISSEAKASDIIRRP